MNEARPLRGLLGHFVLTLKLNFRSRQAIIYGYVMPVLFLLAFAGLFRGDTPLLKHEMGQLLTITVLGGACFGMPTSIVAVTSVVVIRCSGRSRPRCRRRRIVSDCFQRRRSR